VSLSRDEELHAEKLASVSNKLHDLIAEANLTILEGIISLSVVLREALKMRKCDCAECKTLDGLLSRLIEGGLQVTTNRTKPVIQ
jgi:hypothetical protein